MKTILSFISLLIIFTSSSADGQITSLTDAQGLTEGVYTFNFGDGDFQGYVDADGWMLWMQYQHAGGTNPSLSAVQPGNDLPMFDNSPLGSDLSQDLSKWGHGAQDFAVSIPDDGLWLRWEAETSNHTRKIHFESPVLARFLSNDEDQFTPEITYKNIHRDDHTANLPDKANGSSQNSGGNEILIGGPFWDFNRSGWEVNTGGRWNVDDVRNTDESLIMFEHSTIHRVWVKPVPFESDVLTTALDDLQNHINGVQTFSTDELNQIKNTIYIYSENLPESENFIIQALDVMDDYDVEVGPLFTTPTTQNGFNKDGLIAPGFELEKAMIALQQGLFDFVFTPEVYAQFPQLIDGVKFKSCVSFPGDVDPPANATATNTIPIRANFADPDGINPSYNISGDGEEHAFRPTGMYLAPGSVATVTVPNSLVGKDYYIRVGAHEWDLNDKPTFKRLDRISKKFAIESTTIEIFNPLGGAIGILVPYQAAEGIVDVSVSNAVEAPFYSLKSFYETTDFDAELDKSAPWAVFETDNVMYTIPTHSIVPGQHDLMQSMQDWDNALQAINTILGRQVTADKHDLYMISDVLIRGGAFSIGYPMSNSQIDYSDVPGPANFIDGPGPRYEVNFHEYGHASRISKYPGEGEAIVNFLYIMAMNYGLGEDLDEAVKFSFVPNTYDIDNALTHRLVSDSFGSERDITNSTKNEVRYQHRGYGHYFEIVNLFGWCAHQNFWTQEFIDFENGIDHGINDQNIDSRIVRMSIAADADLRPLFQVFGILPQNPTAVQNDINSNDLSESLILYNRLQDYLDLIPEDNAEFLAHALLVYPNLMTAGPNNNPDFGVGWHYLKSLVYDTAEAQSRTTILQDIIDQYFPNGEPSDSTNPDLCCIVDPMVIDLDGDLVNITGGTPPYTVMTDITNNIETITVTDATGCESIAQFTVTSISEEGIEDIRIYPNPASRELYLDLARVSSKVSSLQLVTINGQEIRKYSKHDTVMNVSGLNDGIYVLEVLFDNGLRVNKRVLILK